MLPFTPEMYSIVGRVSVELTTPEGNGVTVRRVCRFATDPEKTMTPAGLEPDHCILERDVSLPFRRRSLGCRHATAELLSL